MRPGAHHGSPYRGHAAPLRAGRAASLSVWLILFGYTLSPFVHALFVDHYEAPHGAARQLHADHCDLARSDRSPEPHVEKGCSKEHKTHACLAALLLRSYTPVSPAQPVPLMVRAEHRRLIGAAVFHNPLRLRQAPKTSPPLV